MSSSNVLKILFDREGTLWIGTDRGLNKFDKNRKSFVHYMHSADDTNSKVKTLSFQFMKNINSELWVGTFSGLNKMDRNSEKFTHSNRIGQSQKHKQQLCIFFL
ncbi:MAG: hypothetical protein IPL53_04810 [Ignavibacteria bacterium]|nr:hypothetical protein [Ignavibacteria bacterium]